METYVGVTQTTTSCTCSLTSGQAFVEEVAQRYGHTDIEQLTIKLQYFSMVDQIGTILDGVGRALEGQEETAWRRLKQLLQC